MDAIVSLAFTGGGIVSNVADVAEWGNSLYGGRATSKSTLDTILNSISPNPDEDGDRLGYGVMGSTKLSATDYFIGHDGNAPGYRSIMFYQPDRKMTLVVLTNFHGADIYAIGRALYAALPNLLCGNKNKKEDKIQVCFNGKNICVDRQGVPSLIQKGAYLGGCTQSDNVTSSSLMNVNSESQSVSLNTYPNPFTNHATISFKVAQTSFVSLQVYDLNGRLISTLYNTTTEKNDTQKVNFEAGKLSSGMYIIRLHTSEGVVQQKIVLRR
jgi:hypothetical protein